jgi:hypothetical protein
MKALLTLLIVYPEWVLIPVLAPMLVLRWFVVPADRNRTEWLLVIATLSLPANLLAKAAADGLSYLRPLKDDLFIYRIDAFFGQPSFQLGQIVASRLWLKILVSTSYGFLPLAIVGTLAAYLWLRPKNEVLSVVRIFLLNLFLALGIYLLIPVCGPAYAFPQFPLMPPANLAPHLMAISAAPNGVPSVHASTAMLVLWFLRRWRWGLAAGIIFLSLTVLATMSSGEHYFVDILCALPYAAGVVWLDSKLANRLAKHPSTASLVEAD